MARRLDLSRSLFVLASDAAILASKLGSKDRWGIRDEITRVCGELRWRAHRRRLRLAPKTTALLRELRYYAFLAHEQGLISEQDLGRIDEEAIKAAYHLSEARQKRRGWVAMLLGR